MVADPHCTAELVCVEVSAVVADGKSSADANAETAQNVAVLSLMDCSFL